MTAGTRLAVIFGVLFAGLVGWIVAGYPGAAGGLALGVVFGVVRWWRLPLWSWLGLVRRRNHPIELPEPVTVANDRSGGGVRYLGDVAVVAVQVLGRAHTPTLFMGSTATSTDNVLDLDDLHGLLRQSLGLTVESMSVVSFGARRRATGDYPRVYDTLIGTPPYAGQRETWVIARVPSYPNADALQWRLSAGTAALAVAQRISAHLRCRGVRARVATATDMVEMERRVGRAALQPGRQAWRSVRGDNGWLSTYWYRPRDINSETLGQAWSLRADGVIQNLTLFADGTATATVTVRTTQPLATPPSVIMRTLPGQQAAALAASMCGLTPTLRGVRRAPAPAGLIMPVGASGVLIGKVGAGDRMMLPFSDPGEFSRVHIAADDVVAKRLVVRTAGAGDRITVHTRDPQRWATVRMPDIAVTDGARPAGGTTVCVTDGPLAPVPRPNTVITVGEPGGQVRGSVDVLITQIGPALVEVRAAGQVNTVEVELFRAENRYVSAEPLHLSSDRELVEERR
ncbi:type VII secretion protein EccE [Mycolicibacterium confluentis]|uniref:ESX-2 secretion system protein EccE2 n=1 Tax=Mycolicibacterium confluentis TaxID=28047 RepID=A0A7I7Y4N6_9MYCO|nr:type VII secretion protein EccE [Mycolicibacterium confluentis]MCV7319016.1 type VII secretion protein EccE [Mycolicibacterium confluentis]ORV33706.1 type VII secretion protein EccE [Mycolicibacterium confluentis]BBZ36626.1 ESX-2 secretion system protein EccE2 [Mycolicibacterium confluentis]